MAKAVATLETTKSCARSVDIYFVFLHLTKILFFSAVVDFVIFSAIFFSLNVSLLLRPVAYEFRSKQSSKTTKTQQNRVMLFKQSNERKRAKMRASVFI